VDAIVSEEIFAPSAEQKRPKGIVKSYVILLRAGDLTSKSSKFS
jgi:hypothetical protein